MKNKAIIFDVDGVLVDSYQTHLQSWLLLAEQTGVKFAEPQFAATFGQTTRQIIRKFWPVSLTDEQVAGYDDLKENLYRQVLTQEFPAMPGAAELVDSLHAAGFHLAVGSSGPAANVHLSLEKLGRPGLFDAVATGQDVTHGKPDPQVFQIAAERLGRPPRCCGVVEDAPVGIAAANAAGMISVGLTGTVDGDELGEADLVVDALDELTPAVFDRLITEC